MVIARLSLLLLLAAVPAAAQTQPSSGVLQLPKPGAQTPAVPATPPRPAPAAPVQQVAPFATPLLRQPGPGRVRTAPGHPVSGKTAKHPPLVQPQGNAHAVKPAAGTPAPATSPATPSAAPPAPKATPQAAAPAAPSPPKFDPAKGTVTGAPLPRWASLRSDQVNLRRGPGTRYPIDWEYHRRDLPVQIEREFEVWRLVQDQDGIKGWVHEATLSGRRGFIVTGAEQVLREDAADNATPVARLKPGVVGRIRHCDAASAWCEVQVSDYRGWLKRDEFWGTSLGEAVPP